MTINVPPDSGLTVKELFPHIYYLEFDSSYRSAMHMLRFEEYYESPKFKGQIFSLIDFMEWYASEHDDVFSYPADWGGFNVPSTSLLAVRNATIPDFNRYDALMFEIIDQVVTRENGHIFYFISSSKEEPKVTLNHEIAHAFYACDPEYRQAMDTTINAWKEQYPTKYEKAALVLKKLGYHEQSVQDEIHAYCATGLCTELLGALRPMPKVREIFKTYMRQLRPRKVANGRPIPQSDELQPQSG